MEAVLPLLLSLLIIPSLAVRHFKLARAGLYYNKKKPRTVKFKQIFLLSWLLVILYQSVVLYFPLLGGSKEKFLLYFE